MSKCTQNYTKQTKHHLRSYNSAYAASERTLKLPNAIFSKVTKTHIADYCSQLPTFSGSSNSMALLRILSDVTESRLFNMVASKPEVLLSQLVD